MIKSERLNPIERGTLRMKIGTFYFSFKRYAKWYISNTKFSTNRIAKLEAEKSFPHVVSTHQSILLRALRNVDIWMQQNKIHNLKLAIACIDGLVLRPGETMSVWRLIGNPSKRKGYLPGMVLINGEMRAGHGGGLCQLSNLMYWMTLHSELTVTERYRHQYDVFPDAVRTVPFGSGATIAYNYIDLQIKNNTTRNYYLGLSLNDTHLLGEWRSNVPEPYRYEIFEKNHSITQHTSGKYIRSNQIGRKIYDAEDSLVGEEWIAENHAIMMYSPLLAAPDGITDHPANFGR